MEEIVSKVYQVVIYTEVRDVQKLENYAALAGPAMRKWGAKFLARGEPYLVREQGVISRTVIIGWPSRESANSGYESPDYQEALEVLGDGATREFRYLDAFEVGLNSI